MAIIVDFNRVRAERNAVDTSILSVLPKYIGERKTMVLIGKGVLTMYDLAGKPKQFYQHLIFGFGKKTADAIEQAAQDFGVSLHQVQHNGKEWDEQAFESGPFIR